MTLSEMSNLPKWLKKITGIMKYLPILRRKIIVSKTLPVLILIPLNILLLFECHIKKVETMNSNVYRYLVPAPGQQAF